MSELQPLAPPELDRIVKQCLQKDPDERFQSARDLMEGVSCADWSPGESTLAASARLDPNRVR